MNDPYDLRFKGPFTMQIAGSTSSGKSFFVRRLLEHANEMIYPPLEKIIYAYGEWQPMFEEMKNVEFVHGVTESLVERENLAFPHHSALVIDDLEDTIDPSLASALFTRISHHRNLSVIFLINNLFYRGLKSLRDIALNTQYNVIFKSARDAGSISTMARQMFGQDYKYMIDAYEQATKVKYGYLVIDSKASTPDLIRLRTQIFPGETPIVYTSKHGKK